MYVLSAALSNNTYLKFEGIPNISVFFLWSSEKYRVYHVLKVRFHTRLLKPRAYGLWLNSANTCEIFHFQLLIYNILIKNFHCRVLCIVVLLLFLLLRILRKI
jgi:hypothetical protein